MREGGERSVSRECAPRYVARDGVRDVPAQRDARCAAPDDGAFTHRSRAPLCVRAAAAEIRRQRVADDRRERCVCCYA